MFAQNVKEGVITFALTETYQTSVSTSTKANQGSWSQQPGYYKTAQRKVTERTILDCIGQVLHGSPNYYSRTGTSSKPAARLNPDAGRGWVASLILCLSSPMRTRSFPAEGYNAGTLRTPDSPAH